MKTDCITDDEMAAFAQGSAHPQRITSIQEHISSCAECRTVAAELARTSGARPRPRALGRYELHEPVGAGGMGTVFSAWDPTLNRQVAVKLLHEAAVDGHRAERFLLERQVLASLEHPHIARLLDAGETEEGRPWFAMDFVDGKPLDLACDEAKLTVQQRVELMLPVLRAVTAAHQHLVVHRDLKPSNILVDRSGAPRLVDFGIARLLEGASGLTQTGMTPMTPAYASPEQVRREPAAVTTDVYSLGVVLYELFTGVSPYETKAGDVEALLGAVTAGVVKPPSEAVVRASDVQVAARGGSREALRATLQGDLDAIVLMALRRDPSDRYQSVQALTDDLTAALEGRPTLARRGDRAYRAALFVRRNRALVAGLSAAFVALSVGLVATIWQARRAEAERDLARSRFEQVRQLAKAVLFDYHDGIADLPGSTALRQRLVKDAQGYLAALATQVEDDASLKQELATSYLKLGDVQGDPFGASLGDTAAAKRSYLEGQRLARAIVAADPSSFAGRRALASSAEKLAAIEEVTGDLEEAVKGYLEAVAIDTQLLGERPDDFEQMTVLGRDELAAAQTLMQLGRLDDADTHLARSLALRRKAAGHGDALSRRAVAAVLITVTELRSEQGRLPEAFEAANEAASVFEALSKEKPDAIEYRRGVQRAHAVLATLFQLTRDFEQSLKHSRLQADEALAVLKLDPANSVAQRDAVVGLTNLAQMLESSDRHAESWDFSEQALALQRDILARDAANVQSLRDYASVLGASAYAALTLGKSDVAEARAREVIALTFPPGEDNVVTTETRAFAWHTLSLVMVQRGRFDEARRAAVRYIELLESLLQADDSQQRIRNRVALAVNAQAETWVRAAEASHTRADWLAADEVLKRAVELSTPLEAQGKALEALKSTRDEREALRKRIDAALAGKPLPPMGPILAGE